MQDIIQACVTHGTWKMKYNETSTTEVCKEIVRGLIKIIWHYMSERKLDFGSEF